MNKVLIAFGAVGGFFLLLALVVGLMWMSANNTEVSLRNSIVAKQRANQATFDNMFKQISQVAEVTDEQTKALKDIFTSHAQARQGDGSDKAIMKWITESIPNVDTKVFQNLQNIIVGARNSFTGDQVALLDLKRAHDDVLTKFPSSLFVGGRSRIDVTIVTSSRTDAAFSAGKDDNTKVFNR